MADDLDVVFGADVAGLASGIDQARDKLQQLFDMVAKAAGNVAKGAENVAAAFGEVGEAVALGLAVINGINAAILEFGRSVAETGAQIERGAAAVGVGVEQFQQLSFAATMSDVSTQSMSFALERLEANMAKAEAGSKTERDAFDRMGVSLTDASGRAKDVMTVLNETADAFSRHADGAQKTALAITLLGRSGAQMIPILDQGSDGLADLGAKGQAAGAVFSQRLVKAMDDTNEKAKTLDGAINGLKGVLFDALKPVIDQVIGGFTAFVQSLTDGVGGAAGLEGALYGLVVAFEDLQKSVALVEQGFLMLFSIGGTVVTSLGASITALGASIVDALSGHWDQILGEFDKADATIRESVVGALKTVADAGDAVDRSFQAADSTLADFAERLRLLPLQRALDAAAAAKAAALGGRGGGAPAFAPPADQTMIAANTRAIEEVTKSWDTFFTNIIGGFDRAVSGLINGTMNWKQATLTVIGSVWQEFAKLVEQMVARWAAGEAMKLAASVAAVHAQTAAIAAGQTAQSGIVFAGIIKQLLASAEGVFGGIFSFLSPVMGPAAAIPATAGSASVAAAAAAVPLATGAWEIPGQMLALLHPGESVLPQPFAESMRSAMSGGGGGPGGGDVHIHLSAIDTRTGAQFLRENAGEIAKAIKSEVRRMNSRLRPAWAGA